MIDPTDRGQFAALVADLGWPACRLGHRTIEAIEWDQVIPHLTLPDRRALVPRLARHVLVATEGARERLRAWLDHRPAGRPFDEGIHLFGDLEYLPLISAAVAKLPAYVRACIANEVAFLGVGLGSSAWFASTKQEDHVTGARLAHQIVLSPKVTERVVLHECAHAWLSQLPNAERAGALTAQGETAFMAMANRSGWKHRIDSREQQQERYAETLALAWSSLR